MGKGKKNSDDMLGALVGVVIAFVIGLLCFLMCCCPTSRKIRIGLTWFWAISLALTSGLCLAFVTFAAVDRDVLREQDIEFTRYRGFFNDRIRATTNYSTNFFFYRERMPDISYKNKIETNYNLIDKYGSSLMSARYYVFHLLKGTKIRQFYKISQCCNNINFFIVKGKANYNSWEGKKYNYQRKDAAVYYKTLYYSFRTEPIKQFDFTINDTADYYFIYAAFGSPVTINTLVLQINRTTYNKESSVYSCLAARYCAYSLPADLQQIAVVISSENGTINRSNETRQVNLPLIASSKESTREKTAHKMKLRISVTPKIWPYLVMFGVLPFFLACVVSLMIWKFCKDCDSIFSNKGTTDNEDATTSSPEMTVSTIEPQHNQAFAPPEYPGGEASAPAAAETNFQQYNYNVQYGGFADLNKNPEAPPSYDEAVRK